MIVAVRKLIVRHFFYRKICRIVINIAVTKGTIFNNVNPTEDVQIRSKGLS